MTRLLPILAALPLTLSAQTLTVREGFSTVLPAPAIVEYGAGSSWSYRAFSAGEFTCNNVTGPELFPIWGANLEAIVKSKG